MTETKNMRVAVVGTESFTLGFRMAGVNASYEMDPEVFPDRVDAILDDEQGVLIVAADHMNELREKKRLQIQNAVDPVVIPLGDESEDADLRTKIKQAIGVDLWEDDE